MAKKFMIIFYKMILFSKLLFYGNIQLYNVLYTVLHESAHCYSELNI